MDTVVRRFARRLYNLRMEHGLTQEALAARAKLHPGYVSALECSRQIPSLTTLEQLAKGLNVDLAALVDFPDTSSNIMDRVRDEIELITRRLKRCDLAAIRRVRKAVEALTAD